MAGGTQRCWRVDYRNSNEVTALLEAGAAPLFSRAWLRERLARGVPAGAALGGDPGGNFAPQLTPAAVLVLVVERTPSPAILFTRRTAHLNDHAGQISFPGGRAEAGDGSAVETALRETREEIGVEPARVEILGQLPEYITRTGFRITPVVGFLAPPLELKPDSFEVAEVFEVPLTFLLDPANHQQHALTRDGITRQFWAMPYQGHYIWGATAGMLMNLYRCLLAPPP